MAPLLALLLLSVQLTFSASVPPLPRRALQQHSPDLPAGVLRIDTTAQPVNHAKRQTDSAPISRHVTPNSYWITVTVGDPAQSIPVLLDSGSSDTWFQARNACVTRLVPNCGNYAFDPLRSSTYTTDPSLPKFSVEYQDFSYASGSYFTDLINVGDATVSGLRMALATQNASPENGVLGIGLPSQESVAIRNKTAIYPTLVDVMYSSGLIGARAYSLYLNSLSANTGTILFGGVDVGRFTGDLCTYPMVNATNGQPAIAVGLSSISITDTDGSQTFTPSQGADSVAAIVDTGTSLTYLPYAVFQPLVQYFELVEDTDTGLWLVNCDHDGEGTIDFLFGGANGSVISVPFSEMIVPTGGLTTQTAAQCAFGIQLGSAYTVLGDTFLRSAYTVVDFDAQSVSFAQASYNSVENPDNVFPLSR